MKSFVSKFQIGKNGLTEGSIKSIDAALKTHRQVRISVLKSAARDKEKIKSLSDEILKRISHSVKTKIIGFTIILNKQ